jgi:hypothetical protein
MVQIAQKKKKKKKRKKVCFGLLRITDLTCTDGRTHLYAACNHTVFHEMFNS